MVYTEWSGDIKRSAIHKRRTHPQRGNAGESVEIITRTTIGDCDRDPTGKEAHASGGGRKEPAEASQATFVAAKQAATRDN